MAGDCEVRCTRSTYHTLQEGNGNFLNAVDKVNTAAGATSLITLPPNCLATGVYYRPSAVNDLWKFIDLDGNADMAIVMPALNVFSPFQCEVINRASGETNIASQLNLHKEMLGKFSMCNLIQQDQKSISVTNNTGVSQYIELVYIDYSWILAKTNI